MHFLPDIYVPCDVCKSKRYNRETLEIKYKGKNIHETLEMTIEEAREFFDAVPALARKLQTLMDVGLSYIKLGQSATTLSGGEAQRVKLSASCPSAIPARPCTSSTSRPPACTSRISSNCSTCCIACATTATPWW
jgi:excinuclease ABC subunit A